MVQLINPASLGDVTIENVTESLPANTLATTYQEVGEGTYNLPAGSYLVRVKNIGVFGNVSVNGDTVTPNQEWTVAAKENRNIGRTDFAPAVTIIVPVDGLARYQTENPSI